LLKGTARDRHSISTRRTAGIILQETVMARLNLESMESRDLMSNTPLPVLLVIADQRDFFYQEYGDTRNSLTAAGVPVVVAATTTAPSTPHAQSGQGSSSGIVTPDIALGTANAANYSAIAFVGGWGASRYQYAFNDPNFNGINDNSYFNSFYNGDTNLNDGIIAPQKVAVNNLINSFLADNKPVAGVCHGTSVLMWARTATGASPVAGKQMAVPLTQGTPGMIWNGTSYAPGWSGGQYAQALANGAIVQPVSGQYGNPFTAADDVIVDGNIITAEDNRTAAAFGTAIAQEVISRANPVVAAVQVNDGAVQRSRVTSLTVTFNNAVTWSQFQQPGAVVLARDGVPLTAGSFTVAPTNPATFTGGVRVAIADVGGDNGSLADGRYTLTVLAAGHTTNFHRLFGDANGDATVDGADVLTFGNAFNTANAAYDFDNSGGIDGSDVLQLGNRFGRTL
jgi:putative intracellular protease/amidase